MHQRSVRCGQLFLELVHEVSGDKNCHFVNAVEVLYRLWERCMPHARHIFTGNVTPLRLLHVNDYIMEKTFVYGILCLSKWLGDKKFPQGVYAWPPQLPPNLALDSSKPVAAKSLKKVAPLSAHIEDDYVAPHLRKGSPAGSSKDSAPK